MTLCMGIITVRNGEYHPNRRLLEAARLAGHQGCLIHPYRMWPTTVNGSLGLTGDLSQRLPDVVLPRQGAQIGDACLALIRHFQLLGIALVNDSDAVTIARNKFLTHQALTAAGVPCPDTVLVNEAVGFFHAVDRLDGYPLVVKPVSERQGAGVMRVMDQDDARRRALPALDRRWGLMVQRYLPPGKRQDIRALVIGGKLICAATLRPADGEFRANFHRGGELNPTDLSSELERMAVGAAAAVGCDVAGVDLIIDADNRSVVMEVNYSPGFKGMEAATGLDIAGRIVQLAGDRCHQIGKVKSP